MLAIVAGLMIVATPSEGSAESARISLRTFSYDEVLEALRRIGIAEAPSALTRLPAADGVRIVVASGAAIEFHCDGTNRRVEIPSPRTFFDSDGKPFAWYEDQELRFAGIDDSARPANQISVDPNGRYFVTVDGPRPETTTRIYRTSAVADALGTTPLAGAHTRIFSGLDEIVVTGDSRDAAGGVVAIAYSVVGHGLVERARIPVPSPRAWFGGMLVAEDASPDARKILFSFWRDPPFTNQLYVFDRGSDVLQRVDIDRYRAFVACDPLAAR
jgi:hypothetical protein